MKNSKLEVFDSIDKIVLNVESLYGCNPAFLRDKAERLNRLVTNESLNPLLLFETACKVVFYSFNSRAMRIDTILNDKKGEIADVLHAYRFDDLQSCDYENTPAVFTTLFKGTPFSDRKYKSIIKNAVLFARQDFMIEFQSYLKEMPTQIDNQLNVDFFWVNFFKLLGFLKANDAYVIKQPISLLHFLLELGYPCVKPDSSITKAAKQVGFLDFDIDLGIFKNCPNDFRERALITYIIQSYCVEKQLKPSLLDLYFMIKGDQSGARYK
jgi:hypothetical protein